MEEGGGVPLDDAEPGLCGVCGLGEAAFVGLAPGGGVGAGAETAGDGEPVEVVALVVGAAGAAVVAVVVGAEAGAGALVAAELVGVADVGAGEATLCGLPAGGAVVEGAWEVGGAFAPELAGAAVEEGGYPPGGYPPCEGGALLGEKGCCWDPGGG